MLYPLRLHLHRMQKKVLVSEIIFHKAKKESWGYELNIDEEKVNTVISEPLVQR